MDAVTLEYAAPAQELRDYVSVFYDFQARVPHFEDSERAGIAQMRILLAGSNGRYVFADGNTQPIPEIMIVGPTTGVTEVSGDGPIHIFGCGLLPAGWGACLDVEASIFVNRVIDARDLAGRQLDGLAERIRALPSFEARVAMGNDIIRAMLKDRHGKGFDFTKQVGDWLASDISPNVDDLVAAVGVSRRQVERLCKRFYGAPPKMLARKYRALRVAVSLARGDTEADELLESGFYDQSHFIREIKQFTGVTPGRIREDMSVIGRLMLKRSELAGIVDPLIYET